KATAERIALEPAGRRRPGQSAVGGLADEVGITRGPVGDAVDRVRVERVVEHLAGADFAVDAIRVHRLPAIRVVAGALGIAEPDGVVDLDLHVGDIGDRLVRVERVYSDAVHLN